MKKSLRNVFIGLILSITCLTNAKSQSTNVLDPTDTLVTYDSTRKPVAPPTGKIGKWVRTVMVNWKTDMYKAYIYNGAAFRLRYPKSYNPTAADGKKYPILVFFHGYGEHDTSTYDNEFQLLHGADFFNTSIENGTYDGYVLFMQSAGYWGTDYYQKIQDILNYMIANNKVDPFQILANGLSAGGQAVWESLINYPNLYSAGIPLSWSSNFYWAPSVVNALKYTPMWLFQGGQDVNPAPYTTHQVRDSFLTAGANFKYTEISFAGHDTWDGAWNNMDFFPFLLRTYSSNPWTLNGKTEFFTTDTIKATIGLAPGFAAYQWRKDGVIIPGDTSNSITATQLGVYDARVQRNGLWSDWSRTPVTLKMATVTKIPAKIEAESYTKMSGIKTEPTSDSLGGLDVGYIDNGDWMDYNIHVDTAGTYVFNFRIASPYSDGQLQVRTPNRTVLGTLNIQSTGDWQNWKTLSDTINLAAGDQTIRILATGTNQWNINWFTISKSGAALPGPAPSPAPVSNYVTLPATIEAENYNNKNAVQTESTTDVGGGLDVAYINSGSWMDYNVHTLDTGTYTVSFRLASPINTAQFQIQKANGTVLNTVNVPQTGGWQNWQTASAVVKLDSGDQVVRIYSLTSGWNINWLSFAKGGVAPAPTPVTTPPPAPAGTYVTIPATIEAESFTAMQNVQKESTTDIGGGQDVGYTASGSWMDYNIHVTDSGAYTVNMRLASPTSTAQFQFRKADGSVLTTVAVPNTGDWQTWQTASTTLLLDTGNQVIRIYSLTSGWNINWFSFSKGGVVPPQPVPVPTSNYVALPDTIQAESYIAMQAVQKEPVSDLGGGLDVGYINPGSWMDYNVNPTVRGSYTFSVRVASPISTAQLQLRKSDGTVLTTVTIPNTGGWQNWQTASTTVTLDTGNQVLRVYSLTSGWNINWLSFTSPIAQALLVNANSARSNVTPADGAYSKLNVYPNPARDQINLLLNNSYHGQLKIQVVSMNGMLEKEFNIWKNSSGLETIPLNISGINKGQHLVRIVSPTKVESIKIIKL